jgi:hypothetical protein
MIMRQCKEAIIKRNLKNKGKKDFSINTTDYRAFKRDGASDTFSHWLGSNKIEYITQDEIKKQKRKKVFSKH